MDVFQSYDIEDVVRIGIALVILFSGLISILFVLWGGFLLIVSGGKEEKIKPAVNHMRHAVIGLLFIFLVIFIAPKITDLLGLPGSEYFAPNVVFATINELSSSIFNGSTGSDSIDFENDPIIDDDFSEL